MVLPITKLPAAILRRPVVDVTFPLSKDIRRLLKDMVDTVIKADGIGLAAPQVSRNLNLAIIFLEHAGVPLFPIINPVIVSSSKETKVIEEGCLSLPGVFGKVTRPKKITFEYFNLQGEKQTITDDDWIARVAQHEIDHLLATLIVDKFDAVTQGAELLPKYAEHKT
ncbi:MAG: peptide deformylase [Candidatus Doudnabacteria bacterium]|nr:peptide deformylase [Candidatus Doudnabacteria bacterium]